MIHHSPLAEALQHHSLALFLGGDLPASVTGVPSRAEMARALARRHGLEASPSLAQVAQQVGRGGWRRAFTVFLREQLQGASPQPFHRRVVAVAHEHGVQTLVSTAYDGLLRRAFDDAGGPVEVVWKDSQFAVAFQDRPLLIQLYGNPLADVESLIVTEDDHLDLWRDRRRESVLDEVKRALQRNTVLFLGYNLSDPDVRLLWREVLSRAGDLHRRAFAVWPGLPAAEVDVWADRGIEILEEDPWGLMDGGVAMRHPPTPATTTPSPAPPSMPAQLHQQVQRALLRCGPFRSDNALRPLFIDRRISPWRDRLPSANSPIERAQATIEYLFLKSDAEGTNALVLLLRVLRDQTSQGDACYGQLDKLAKELDALLKGQGSTAATKPHPPSQKGQGANVTLRQKFLSMMDLVIEAEFFDIDIGPYGVEREERRTVVEYRFFADEEPIGKFKVKRNDVVGIYWYGEQKHAQEIPLEDFTTQILIDNLPEEPIARGLWRLINGYVSMRQLWPPLSQKKP